MNEFFKTLLKGVIYVVLLPVIALFLALFFVYCICIFLYTAVRNLIIFFAGGNPGGDLKEDVEAKRRLAEKMNVAEPKEVVPADQPELVRPSDLQAESEGASLTVHEEESEEGGIDDGNSSETF